MTAFDGLFFFFLLALALLPAAVLGLAGKRLRVWGMLVNLLFLCLFYNTWLKAAWIVSFWLLQLLCVSIAPRMVKTGPHKKWIWLPVVLSVLPLLFSKALGVLQLPIEYIGVSYMTFRALGLILECYDGLCARVNLLDFSYYLLFFPCIGSGPIDRYRRFAADLAREPDREAYAKELRAGVFDLVCGAFYNFGVSALLWQHWVSAMPDTALGTVGYMYGYTFFLFFNFAGYSRMAIGTGRILGIRVPQNFNLPFLSVDLKDFWSRWHISLSTWFRDYLYTRFVMSALQKKWFKHRHTGSYIGYVLTMMTMGLWHGFAPHYIVYGAYHGLLMCANDVLDNRVKAFKPLKRNGKAQPALCFITFHIIAFGMLIFSGRLF